MRLPAGTLNAGRRRARDALPAGPEGQLTHALGKLALLVAGQLVLLRSRRRRETVWRAAVTGPARWRAIGPATAVTGWGLLAFASPLAVPASDYADTVSPVELIAVGFLVNAVVEEVFYRRWLLSRAQAWLGTWPNRRGARGAA